MMFSQEESDVVNRDLSGRDDSDAGSIRGTVVPTSMKNSGQGKRVIGGDELDGYAVNFAQLSINGNGSLGS